MVSVSSSGIVDCVSAVGMQYRNNSATIAVAAADNVSAISHKVFECVLFVHSVLHTLVHSVHYKLSTAAVGIERSLCCRKSHLKTCRSCPIRKTQRKAKRREPCFEYDHLIRVIDKSKYVI